MSTLITHINEISKSLQRSEVSLLKHDLEVANQERGSMMKTYTDHVNNCRQRVTGLQQQLNVLAEERDAALQGKKPEDAAQLQLQQRVTELQQQLNVLAEERDAALQGKKPEDAAQLQQRVTELSHRLEKASRLQQTTEQTLVNQQSIQKKWEAREQSLLTQLNVATRDRDQAQQKQAALEQQLVLLTQLQDQLEAAKRETATLSQQLMAATTAQQELQTRITAALSAQKVAEDRAHELSEQTNAQMAYNEQLREQLRAAEAKSTETETEIYDLREHIAAAEAYIAETEEQIKDLREQLSVAEADAETKEDELEDAQEDLAEQTEYVEQLQRRLYNKEVEYSKCKAKEETMKLIQKTLRENVSNMAESTAAELSSVHKQRDDIQKQLQKTRAEYDDLTTQRGELYQRTTEMEGKITDLTNQLREKELHLLQKNEDVKAVNAELLELRTTTEQAQILVDELNEQLVTEKRTYLEVIAINQQALRECEKQSTTTATVIKRVITHINEAKKIIDDRGCQGVLSATVRMLENRLDVKAAKKEGGEKEKPESYLSNLEIVRWQAEAKQMSEIAEQYRQMYVGSQQKLKQTDERLVESKNKSEQQSAALENLRLELERSRRLERDVQAEISECKKTNEQCQTRLVEYGQEIQTKSAEIEKKAATIAELEVAQQAQASITSHKIATLEASLSDKDEQIQRLIARQAAKIAAIPQLSERVAAAKSARVARQEKLAALYQKMAKTEQSKAASMAKLRQLQQQTS